MNRTRCSTLTVRTAEGIEFSFLLASPVARFLAYSVDFACFSALTMLGRMVLGLFLWINPDFGLAVGTLLFFVIQTGYSMACEWLWRGQTVGKRLLRMRVVDSHGLRLQFNQVVIRNLLRFVDMLPGFYLVGGLVAWFNRCGQRLGDVAANTIVIRNPQIDQPDLTQILAGKFNSFRSHPNLEARLRDKVSPQEAGLALQALLRRDELDPRSRIDIFAQLRAHFSSLVVFPPESIEGITDEQYVRNIVDSVFRPRRTGIRSRVA